METVANDMQTKRKRVKRTKKMSERLLDIALVILVIVTALVLAFRFTTSEARVVGQSMMNTLNNDEHLVYEKITGYIGDYKKGDILILEEKSLNHSQNNTDNRIVKRLIAQGGDTLSFSREGNPIVNGTQQAEGYVKDGANMGGVGDLSRIIQKTNEKYGTQFDVNSQVIPQGYYFVMGDNRANSSDSRVFGLYQKGDIAGRVAYSYTYHRFY